MNSEQPARAASADTLQFDTAEPSSAEARSLSCAVCSQDMRTVYHEVNGKTVCSGCRAGLEAPSAGSFTMAAVYGLGAGALCAAVGGTILAATGWYIVAAIVGFIVGRAVLKGSGSLGGPKYQVLALVLTYLAATGTFVPLIFAEAGSDVPAAVAWVGAWISALILPFVLLTASPFTTVIIGFSLWEAWRVTKRADLVFTGPHAVAAPADAAEPVLA